MGIRVEGTVTDPTNALIPGAEVQAADGLRATTDPAGRFSLACVSSNSGTLVVRKNGFSTTTVPVAKSPGRHLHLTIACSLPRWRRRYKWGRTQRVGRRSRCRNDEPERRAGATATCRRSGRLDPAASDYGIERRGRAPNPRSSSSMDFRTQAPCRPRTRSLPFASILTPYSPEYEGPTFQGGRVEIHDQARCGQVS